jgi:membrane protein DedA with SNARE-associated domain
LTAALTNLVHNYGLLAVLLLMAAESCGLPFPSEAIMPAAGLLVATGHLNFVLVVLAGTVGNLAGSLVAYGIAARWGHPLLLGPGRWIGIRPGHVRMADRWFERHGLLAVLVGRVLPVVRTYISFPAGLARVPLGRFALLTFVGAAPWCAALTAVGYSLGANYDRVTGYVGKAAIVVALAVLVVVVVWFLRGRSGADGVDAAAEPAVPAPPRR